MDWPSIMQDLKGAGWTLRSIHRHVQTHVDDVGYTTLHDLKSGKTRDPAYSVGRAVEDLHKRVMRRRRVSADAAA